MIYEMRMRIIKLHRKNCQPISSAPIVYNLQFSHRHMNAQLTSEEYPRYGRQMILDGFGLPGQLKLKNASVAVVGAGGLGCPAIQYLAAAGVGRICVIDHDVVEVSNLQRQILHDDSTVGIHKSESAARAIARINPNVVAEAVCVGLLPDNAADILRPHDVILDCTDNAATRYLLSDVAVALKKPLVSGAAQKYEGQLSIYNLGADGPCYRCIFPRPPAPGLVGSCEEMGILGVVTGVIGNLQALETIKLLTGMHGAPVSFPCMVYASLNPDMKPSMVLFSALGSAQFRSIKMRSRKPNCPACGTAEEKIGQIREIDYVQFCGVIDDLLISEASKTTVPQDFAQLLSSGGDITVVDVRSPTEFGICSLPGSKNIPLTELLASPPESLTAEDSIYFVCRLGNDSQLAASSIREHVKPGAIVKDVTIKDLKFRASEIVKLTVPFVDPRLNGGSMLTLQNEPLNIIVSAASSPDALSPRGILNFGNALGYGDDCLHIHLGGPQAANLGDGNNWVNQTQIMRRWSAGTTTGDTLLSKTGRRIAYMSHSAFIQNGTGADTGALFLAASKEEPIAQGHNIIPDGYDIGRDQVVSAATAGVVSFDGVQYTVSTSTRAPRIRLSVIQTTAEYVTGLLPVGAAGINHNISIDGRVAVMTIEASVIGSDLNCKGSSLCSILSASDCSAAQAKINNSTIYRTDGTAALTGVCSGHCGIFVQGTDCRYYGDTMLQAVAALHGNSCQKCGSKRFADGCEITINYVSSC
ncbi:unnamed protein product [Mycena citricolor]|uniref:Rhodanese domain-containing protein n=1 Tax=Mycena citricolor TaxID=2018698 RepID=A0AAD2HPY8_9AGAR|nr:unnamed protein product [Mycena citricolor]